MKLAVLGGEPVRTKPFVKCRFTALKKRQPFCELCVVGTGSLRRRRDAAFEARFAEMHGCRRALAVPSGTVALKVALLAAGIRSGDEVLIPPIRSSQPARRSLRSTQRRFGGRRSAVLHDGSERLEAAVTERTRFICLCTLPDFRPTWIRFLPSRNGII